MLETILLGTLLAMCIAQVIVDGVRITRRGGLTFWRLGRLGGSVYFATSNRERA